MHTHMHTHNGIPSALTKQKTLPSVTPRTGVRGSSRRGTPGKARRVAWNLNRRLVHRTDRALPEAGGGGWGRERGRDVQPFGHEIRRARGAAHGVATVLTDTWGR